MYVRIKNSELNNLLNTVKYQEGTIAQLNSDLKNKKEEFRSLVGLVCQEVSFDDSSTRYGYRFRVETVVNDNGLSLTAAKKRDFVRYLARTMADELAIRLVDFKPTSRMAKEKPLIRIPKRVQVDLPSATRYEDDD